MSKSWILFEEGPKGNEIDFKFNAKPQRVINRMNPRIDIYLSEGCGRCSMYRTPECEVHTWSEELKQLRRIVLKCGLEEEFKWSQPCYTYQKSNVLLVTAFKEYAALAFFKGVLLNDLHNILVAPGENSQSVRQMRFTNAKDVVKLEPIIQAYICEAIKVEKAGLKVKLKRNPEPIPQELEQKMSKNQDLKTAFEALSPGRQRGYILYFSAPRQPKTRQARIEKCMDKILKGEGLNDSYKSKKSS